MYILYFKEEHNRVVRKSMESESLLLFSIENITHCDYALPLPNLVFLSILRKLFNQQQKKRKIENRYSCRRQKLFCELILYALTTHSYLFVIRYNI